MDNPTPAADSIQTIQEPTAASGASTISEAYADEKQFVAKVQTWFRDCTRVTEEWRADAIESLEFCSGKQWSDADLQLLHEQQRPALVINKVLGPILFLSGLQRQQRTDAACLPIEPGDARGAELMTYLLKWHNSNCREAAIDSHVFMDKIITGIGYWKVRVKYDFDPEGEVVWERVNPLSVYADPNWFDSGWESAQYVMHATWMNMEEAAARWPEQREKIERMFGEWLREGASSQGGEQATGQAAGDSLAPERTFWDKETQRIRLLEVWYTRYVSVDIAVDTQTGQTYGEPEALDRLKRAAAIDPLLGESLQFMKREVRQVYTAKVLFDVLLEHEASPYDEPYFPIWPTLCYYFWRKPISLVSLMKDPQRWFNRHRSTIMEVVRRAAHSGWLNKQDAGANTEDLEKNVAGVGKVVQYRDVKPEPIQPPEVPQTLVLLMRQCEGEINDVSNITREMVGTSTQRTVSGRAILARQRGGLVTQEPILDSFKLDKESAIKFFVSCIQQYVSTWKAQRILGSIVARQPKGPEAQMLAMMDQMQLQDMLNNALLTRYDVVVDPANKPWEPTAKMANFDSLKELAQDFPTPPQVLIEAAQDAGLITEEQAMQWEQYIQMMMGAQLGAQQQGQGPPQGAPPENGPA